MAVGLSSVKAANSAQHISEWRFGKNVSGAPVVMEDTKGKVVVYEYWDETTVTFLMADGKNVDYPLDKLSDESRKIIEEKTKDSK